MNFREFGNVNSKTVMFLHGGGLNWWNYREQAKLLEKDYHIILPILDGHAGSNRPFTTIEDNASEIIKFIDEHLGGSVHLIGGLSLGAQILLEMLSQSNDICRFAVIESAAVLPCGFTHALIGPSVGCSYFLVKRRWFAKMQFNSLHMDPKFFDDYYRDTCEISKKDMVAFLKANTAYSLKASVRESSAEIHVFAGGHENSEILKSTDAIADRLPNCTVKILPNLFHGQFSLCRPEDYVNEIKSMLLLRKDVTEL